MSKGSKFDLNLVTNSFEMCTKDGEIDIVLYIEAYRELVGFFDLLGTLFSFVTSDVHSKISILRQHNSGPNGDQYKSIQRMVKYEKENDITVVKNSSELPSGSRTLLRLHRALEFILKLFVDLKSAGPDDKMSHITHGAYDSTLSKYHPWLVRKSVGIAVYAAPSRKDMLGKMLCDDEEDLMKKFDRFNDIVQPVYDGVQALYAEYDILDLP